MKSSLRDTLLFIISCGGHTSAAGTGLNVIAYSGGGTVLAGGIGLAGARAAGLVTVLAWIIDLAGTAGLIVGLAGTILVGADVLTGTTVWAVLVGAITLIETVILWGIMGIMAFATFFEATARTMCAAEAFLGAILVLNSGAVVEVPQSVQVSLYSTSLRPHFRQNGIGSL